MSSDATEFPVGPCTITIDGTTVDLQEGDASVTLGVEINEEFSADYGVTPVATFVAGDLVKIKFGQKQWTQTHLAALFETATTSGSYKVTFGRKAGTAMAGVPIILTTIGGSPNLVITLYSAYVRVVEDITIAHAKGLTLGVECVGMIDTSRSTNDLLYNINLTAAVATAPGAPTRTTPASDSSVSRSTTIVINFGSDDWDVIRKEFLTTDYFKLFDTSEGAAAEAAVVLTYNSAQQIVTLTPSSTLAATTLFIIQVSNLIRNTSNVPMADDFASSFTTAA